MFNNWLKPLWQKHPHTSSPWVTYVPITLISIKAFSHDDKHQKSFCTVSKPLPGVVDIILSLVTLTISQNMKLCICFHVTCPFGTVRIKRFSSL